VSLQSRLQTAFLEDTASVVEEPMLTFSDSDDEDETAALMAELAKIKQERAEEKARQVSTPSQVHTTALGFGSLAFSYTGIYPIALPRSALPDL
jgi:hypothetical protein